MFGKSLEVQPPDFAFKIIVCFYLRFSGHQPPSLRSSRQRYLTALIYPSFHCRLSSGEDLAATATRS